MLLTRRLLLLLALSAGACIRHESDSKEADIDQDLDGFPARVDCDDQNADIHPEAEERCNGLDDDCDTRIDEPGAIDERTFYRDADHDGFGDPALTGSGCDAPDGYADNSRDCDDSDPAIHPKAAELCNGLDDDCDLSIDEEATDAPTWYPDTDNDGYGTEEGSLSACEPKAGHSSEGGDCDDLDPVIHPHAPDLCEDTIDSDCDGHDPLCGLEGAFSIEVALGRIHGRAQDDFLGAHDAIAGPGDLDGDGFDDLLLGARGSDEAGTDSGIALLFMGPVVGSFSASDADYRVTATSTGDALGASVAGPGDLDGDSFPDLLIGAPMSDLADTDSGAAYLLRGPLLSDTAASAARTVFFGSLTGDQAGSQLAGAGDTDSDGRADLIIAASRNSYSYDNAGSVYLFSNPPEGLISVDTASAIFRGAAEGDRAGISVAGIEDLNGDHFSDIAVGAWSADTAAPQAGAVHVLYGPFSGERSLAASDALLSGIAEDEQAGASVAGVGDVNHDGYDDLLLGSMASGGGAESGAAYLLLGPIEGARSLASSDAILLGEKARDAAGFRLTGAGDLDLDGYDDFAIGARRHDAPAEEAGAVYIQHGPVEGSHSLAESSGLLLGASSYDFLGSGLASAGDVDADGWADLLLGAMGQDSGGSSAGMVYVLGAEGY